VNELCAWRSQITAVTRRRAASEIIRRATPLNSMLTPISVPSTQEELNGHVLQMMMARISVTTPSTNSQPDPGNEWSRNPKITAAAGARCCRGDRPRDARRNPHLLTQPRYLCRLELGRLRCGARSADQALYGADANREDILNGRSQCRSRRSNSSQKSAVTPRRKKSLTRPPGNKCAFQGVWAACKMALSCDRAGLCVVQSEVCNQFVFPRSWRA
jgi:hypothetical protein